jgi:hypothetical protein
MNRQMPKLPKGLQTKVNDLTEVYRVDYHGMERSGHNAIANWVAALMPPLSGVALGSHTANPKFNGHPAGWHGSGATPYTGAVFCYLPDMHLPEALSRNDFQRVIVSVRDFRNLLASRLRWHEENGRILFHLGAQFRLVWKEYAKQHLGDVDYFDGKAISIYYDKWTTSTKYRQALAKQLAHKFNWPTLHFDVAEEKRTKITGAGGGSSFDGMSRQDPDKLKLTERWYEYKDDPLFNDLSQDLEVLELSNRLKEM